MKAFIDIFKNKRGSTSIEKGLICALIVIAMLTALKGVTNHSISMWNAVSSQTSTAIGGASN